MNDLPPAFTAQEPRPAAPVIFEDEHLLVACKPAGMNTHSPSPFAGEGLYEWLRNREPRWADLAIMHRLDKETSGLIVFTKTPLANRSLAGQFERRRVHKKYILLTDRKVGFASFTARSCLERLGDKYISKPLHAGGDIAETRFTVLGTEGDAQSPVRILAEPLTGRTHQIRVHATEHGFPILGDTFYGGTQAARVCLHAAEISFEHPDTGREVFFAAPEDFSSDPRLTLRTAIIDTSVTGAFRLIHGAADGWPGLYADRLGEFILAESDSPLSAPQLEHLCQMKERTGAAGVYFKQLLRRVDKAAVEAASPKLVAGAEAPEEFVIRENNVRFALRFGEGYSVGLFLDQRENRRRLLTRHAGPDFGLPDVAGGQALNVFAYTCGFSVCAALAGAHVTSLDLSKKYLDWGRRNFELNGLDAAAHDFIYGDAFDWMRRLGKKGRLFDLILLDPPTFSRSKEHGVFRAEKDYAVLISAALPLLKPGGTLFASTNAATLQPDDFLASVTGAISAAGRVVESRQYVPQPPDFPMHRAEPGYLKTVWMRVR